MNPDSDSYGQLSKHYYAGTERIASRLADPAAAFAEPEDLEGAHVEALPALQRMDIRMPLHGWDIGFDDPSFANDTLPEDNCSLYPPGSEEHQQCLCDQEADCPNIIYWFHPDHLGSSTFLTDAAGEPYQFVMYLPFGDVRSHPDIYRLETFAELSIAIQTFIVWERAAGFGTPYLFNAKELDEETGLYYYGARYGACPDKLIGNPRVSMWWGVDPLADKYPEYSPYTYTLNNPINLIDPDGMKVESIHEDAEGNTIAVYNDGDNNVYRHSGIEPGTHPDGKKAMVDQLRESTSSTSGGGEKVGETNLMVNLNTWGSIGAPATVSYGNITIESKSNEGGTTKELSSSGFSLGGGVGFDWVSGARGKVVFDQPIEGQSLKDVFDAAPFVTTKSVGALFKFVRVDAYKSRDMKEKIWHANLFGAGTATATFGGDRSMVNWKTIKK